MGPEQLYTIANEFLNALHDARPPWPSAAVPLPPRRDIGTGIIWPWTSLDTLAHNGRVQSVDSLFDIIHDVQPDKLREAIADVRLAVRSARKLSDHILQCQYASADMLRQELGAIRLAHGIVPGDDYELLLPVAYRLDRIKYGDWETRHVLSLASHMAVWIPDDMTLCRAPKKVSVTWRNGTMTFAFQLSDMSPDCWVTVDVSDRLGELDYFGLGSLAQRIAGSCPDPDSAVALMERLSLMLNLLEEGNGVAE